MLNAAWNICYYLFKIVFTSFIFIISLTSWGGGGGGEGELELRCNAHRVFHELFALLNFKKLSPNPFREKTNKAVVIQVPVAN